MITQEALIQFAGDVQEHKSGLVFKPYDLQCIHQAHTILSKDPPPKMTNEALALEVGINRNKLHYGFKHVYGQTITHFLEQQRMQKAELLLSTTYKSVKVIAALTGYCNSSRFGSVFKKTFGMSPIQYRKQCRSARALQRACANATVA